MLPLDTQANDIAHSALASAGVQAQQIENLWWFALTLCSVVFAAILAAVLLAIRRPRSPDRGAATDGVPRASRRNIAVAVVASAVGLLSLLIVDLRTDHALSRLPTDDPVNIDLVGYQWWWGATYQPDKSLPAFAVANELSVPVGRPIIVNLRSADVIHTFWVPNLHGKKDLLPGRPTTMAFRADKTGPYLGQCAEFCGTQHALMAMTVNVLSEQDYAAWVHHQQAPADTPGTADARRGREIFAEAGCGNCHRIRGTDFSGAIGPDLTHLGSRKTIAAGSFLNTPALLAQWVSDPTAMKPGTSMPPSALPVNDLNSLVAYLGGLQ